MRKISKNSCSKRAFTLIEMMLAIAISMLFVTLIFATFYIVNSSHAKVAVINDAKDFASLNMNAISNMIINSDYILLSNVSISSDPSDVNIHYLSVFYDLSTNKLSRGTTANPTVVFAYDQYKVTSGTVKWKIIPTFSIDSAHSVKVNLDIIDNSTETVTPYYTLTKTIFLANVPLLGMTLSNGNYKVINYHNPDFVTVTPG